MRPSRILSYILLCIFAVDGAIFFYVRQQAKSASREQPQISIVVAGLGLTDLCIATEARYTRNPAVTDHVVPFMDYPGEIEHFPTGSFWAPPPSKL